MSNSNQHSIAFHNLENLFDTKDDLKKNDNNYLPGGRNRLTENKYWDKLNKISHSIMSIHGDRLPLIIGVLEIENKAVLTDSKAKYKFIHFESADKRGIEVALIYNFDYFNVLAQERILAVNAEGSYTTRDILYVEGELKSDIVHFFENHWPSRREGTLKPVPRRITAASCLYSKTQRLIQENPLSKIIIIMGDFNDLPSSKSIISFLKAKPFKNIGADQFYNLASIPYRKKRGTFFAKN
jgi:hypothetical protein